MITLLSYLEKTMKIYKVDRKTKNIKIAIPLTEPTGKTRVKNRDIWYGY